MVGQTSRLGRFAASFPAYRSPIVWCSMLICGVLSSCAPQETLPQTSTAEQSENQIILQENLQEAPQKSLFNTGATGAFLAARQALYENDIGSASQFFSISTQQDKNSADLLQRSFTTHYQNGDLEKASHVARLMERQNIFLPLAAEPAIADAITSEDWQAVIVLSDKIAIHQANIALSNILKAYAYFGQGSLEQMYQALHEFDLITGELGSQDDAAIQLQFAYFDRLSEQDEKAFSIYQELAENPPQNSYLTIKIAEGLWHYGEIEKAKQFLDVRLPASFDSQKILQTWSETQPQTPTLQEFIASSLLELSWFSKETLSAGFLLPRTQLALSLYPDFDAAHYVTAMSFHALNQKSRAEKHLENIQEESIWYQQRILLELDMLQDSDAFKEAIHHIKQYQMRRDKTVKWGEQRVSERALFAKLMGNFLRYQDKCEEAVISYNNALSLQAEDAITWRSLAICYEQTGQIEPAEEAFERALELNPNDAVALNYLGYWWADEGRNLDQAITHIQKAVSLRPGSGYFADSLGWVYYKLGQYDKAVIWLEKAIQLAPTDGIIADHLGDAYWQVGRSNEAKFKWQHALELGLTDDEQNRTIQKIKTGLPE